MPKKDTNTKVTKKPTEVKDDKTKEIILPPATTEMLLVIQQDINPLKEKQITIMTTHLNAMGLTGSYALSGDLRRLTPVPKPSRSK